MTRAAIFAAFRAANPGLFDDPAKISILDGICDDFGIAREESAPANGMQASEIAAGIIAKWEGMATKLPDGRYQAYPDPGTGGKPWTIGVGTTGPDVGPDTIWTREQCLERFHADLAGFGAKVAALLKTALTRQGQRCASHSLT